MRTRMVLVQCRSVRSSVSNSGTTSIVRHPRDFLDISTSAKVSVF